MRFKVLLAGSNKTTIDDFFSHLDDNMESLTTSMRWEDIMGHIKYYRPDVFCYCAANESKENISQMHSVKAHLNRTKIAFVFIGSDEDRGKFEQNGIIEMDDLILRRPIKVSSIEENMTKFLEDRRNAEKQRAEEEARAAEEIEHHTAKEERFLGKEEKSEKRRILVVDDDTAMLKMIKDQLHEQYDVATAINGKVAMKFLESKKTDLILLDYEMPLESGPKVLERLRENAATKNIPVVFLTGVTEREKIMQVVSMRPQGYLVKPINHKDLTAMIDKVLFGGNRNE